MTRFFIGAFLFQLTLAASAAALAAGSQTELYVSPLNGSDVSDCARAYPCQTISRALSMAATNAAIYVTDIGDIVESDTIKITNGINIRGLPGGLVRIRAPSGKPAISVEAPPTDQVSLLYLQINGAGYGADSGTIGIEFKQGSSLRLIDVAIGGFNKDANSAGVAFTPSNSGAALFIDQGRAANNATHILVRPTSGVTAVAINRYTAEFHYLDPATVGGGIVCDATAGGNINFSIADSYVFRSNQRGILVKTTEAAAKYANVALSRVVIQSTNNAVQSDGKFSSVRLKDVTVSSNSVGLRTTEGGTIFLAGNNAVAGNTTDIELPANLRILSTP